MPFVKSLVSRRRIYIIAVILLLGKIIPTYSYYILKGLVYITIIISFSRQPSFYTKHIKYNIHLFCDIRLVSITKYICPIYFINF